MRKYWTRRGICRIIKGHNEYAEKQRKIESFRSVCNIHDILMSLHISLKPCKQPNSWAPRSLSVNALYFNVVWPSRVCSLTVSNQRWSARMRHSRRRKNSKIQIFFLVNLLAWHAREISDRSHWKLAIYHRSSCKIFHTLSRTGGFWLTLHIELHITFFRFFCFIYFAKRVRMDDDHVWVLR